LGFDGRFGGVSLSRRRQKAEGARLGFSQAGGWIARNLVQRGAEPIHDYSNHPGDIPEPTLRVILKQAGIDPDVFLQQK
jgi:hypothetical protein